MLCLILFNAVSSSTPASTNSLQNSVLQFSSMTDVYYLKQS